MDDTRFEELEQLNAQVDVWIDQEEFDLVIKTFKCSPPKTGNDPKDKIDFNDYLEKAFSDNHCTFHLDKEWDDLLNVTFPPLIEFRFPNNSWMPFFKDDSTLEEKWVSFFWAKLLRAKIQQKGSDCYYGRLDQVVVFLERATGRHLALSLRSPNALPWDRMSIAVQRDRLACRRAIRLLGQVSRHLPWAAVLTAFA